MVKCQNCGNEVNEEEKFCKNCGNEIVIENGGNEVSEEDEFKFCANCGFKMNSDLKFCPECGTSTTGEPKVQNNAVIAPEKSPGLAALLSLLIVGLGQIYLGLTKKGIMLFVAAVISGILILLIVGWILWLLVWVYAIYDAYTSAQKLNQGIEVEDRIDFNNLF